MTTDHVARILDVIDSVEGGSCWRCDDAQPTNTVGLCDHCLAILRDPDHLNPPTLAERLPRRDGPLTRGVILGPAFPKIAITPSDVVQVLLDALRPLLDHLARIAARCRR